MPKKKNDLLTLLFLIVGLLAVVDLVYVSVRQKANEDRAQEKLACIAQVVEEAQGNMRYNSTRDAATLEWLQNPGTVDTLKTVLADRPNMLPDCEINWNE